MEQRQWALFRVFFYLQNVRAESKTEFHIFSNLLNRATSYHGQKHHYRFDSDCSRSHWF